jgi:hypothetical protein
MNGVPRTFRDVKESAFDAARFIEQRNRDQIVEVVDRSTGAKVIRLAEAACGVISRPTAATALAGWLRIANRRTAAAARSPGPVVQTASG